MTGKPSRALRILVLAAVVAAVVVGALALTSAGTRSETDGNGPVASPHPLVASRPATGAALTTPPVAVELIFPAPVDVASSHISVQADGGASASTGPLGHPARGTVRQPVAIPGSGAFTVAYHITFTDGTEDSGLLRFSVGTGVPPPPLDATTAEHAVGVAEHQHSIDPLSAVLLVVDGVVGVVVLVLLLRRGRPDP